MEGNRKEIEVVKTKKGKVRKMKRLHKCRGNLGKKRDRKGMVVVPSKTGREDHFQ